MASYNTSHTLRTGFLYEEIWGLDFCGKWLGDPSLFQNIQFQTAPPEVANGQFFLDDIILRTKDDKYLLCQVKHREHSERDPWTWEQLLKPEKPQGKSLLKKWASSYRKLLNAGHVSEASLLTNGTEDPTISRFIDPDGRLRIEEARTQDSELLSHIEDEVGADILTGFFGVFRFRFGQPGHAELASRAEVTLQKLRATESGIRSLCDHLRKEFAAKYPRAISLEEIRAWCEFDIPRQLNETFAIPADFQWFDESEHTALMQRLRTPTGGLQVLVGKPGSGKSTYLAKLHNVLSEEGIVCIRHHYHLSPSDQNPQERLTADRVVEAIKAQFKERQEAIGPLAWLNSAGVDLRDFITRAAEHFAGNGTAYVFIIDGLDHVPRYDSAEGLRAFLQQACQPQPGLWILLGMQEVAEPHLPQIVLDRCPKDSWIEVSGLTSDAVDAIVQRNEVGLTLPNESHLLQPLLRRINTLTGGNPLHLRYSLRQLKTERGTSEVREYDVERLLPFDEQIERYYLALWRQLSPLGRTLLVALQVVNETLSETQLLGLAAELAESPSDISRTYNGVQHLLSVRRHAVETFHISLQVFIADQPERSSEAISILKRIQRWLEGSNEEFLKWGLLPAVKSELGDHTDLLAIDRQWVVEALTCRRPARTVRKLLKAATKAAFEGSCFGKAYELGALHGYFESNTEFSQELTDRLWITALTAARPRAIDIELRDLRPSQIMAVVRLADQQGELEAILDDAKDQVRAIHRDTEFRQKGDWSHVPPDVSCATIEVVSRDRQHDAQRLVDYCLQFRDLGWSADLLSIYAMQLLRTDQMHKVQWLLRQTLEHDELVAILDTCVKQELMRGSGSLVDTIRTLVNQGPPPSVALYLALHGAAEQPAVTLLTYDELPETIPEFDSKSRPVRARQFADGFIAAMVLSLRGNDAALEVWQQHAPRRWPTDMFSVLLQLARQYAQAIQASQPLDEQHLWRAIAVVPPLSWPEDRDKFEWQMGFSQVVREVLDNVVSINRFQGHSVALSIANLAAQVPPSYYNPDQMVEYVITSGQSLLDPQSCRDYIAEERTRYPEIMDEFPRRADHYLNLAVLSGIYADTHSQMEFCRKSASCLLGYGSHKDPYIFHVLNAVEYCHAAGSARAKGWLHRLIPIAVYIRMFTDGDDLQSVPDALADTLSRVDEDVLCNYWAWACHGEEFTLAQTLFTRIVSVIDLRDAVGSAVVRTSLDRESLMALRKRAAVEPEAAAALSAIEETLGATTFPERDQPSSSLKEFGPTDAAAVAPTSLDAYLQTLDSYDRQRFLAVWATYWLASTNAQRATASAIIRARIDETKLEREDGLLLDALAAYELEQNPERAFTLLTWAQANDRGWDSYWNKPEYAVRRWEMVQRHFPGRHYEFFEQSVRRYGQRSKDEERLFFPLPRGIEYFARFGELALVEEVTECAVALVEGLMADLTLPAPPWIEGPSPDPVDMLLIRLCSPSPLVRERCASALAKLLDDSRARGSLLTKMQNWLSRQELETVSQLALLAITKSVLNGTLFSAEELDAVLQVLPYSNVAIDELVEDLQVRTGLHLNHGGRWAIVGEVPPNYTPSKTVLQGMQHGLPPVYLDYAAIAEQSGIPNFRRHWQYVADELVGQIELATPGDDLAYFMGVRHNPRLVAATTQLTEVLKTAFVRVLQHYYTKAEVPRPCLLRWSTSAFPIDLSYWQVMPSRCPEWWPRHVTRQVPSNGIGTPIAGIQYQEALVRVAAGGTSDVILGLNGELLPTSSSVADDISSVGVVMLGFAYEVLGRHLPEAAEVAARIMELPLVNVDPTSPGRCLSFMDNRSHHICMGMESIDIEDLRMYPLVAEVKPWPISTWQWFRGYHPFLTVMPDLFPISSIRPAAGEIEFWSEQRRVAITADWTEGLSDRLVDKHEAHHGTYLKVYRDVLDAWLTGKGLRLGFVARVSFNQQKYRYDDPTVVANCMLFGVSPIVIPRSN